MENKKFLNPQELVDKMSEIRNQAKESIVSLMKANNLTYVHTCVGVCSDANCDTCCCHVYDNKTGCEWIVPVYHVHLTADDKLGFYWFDEDDEGDDGTIEERNVNVIDMINIYNTVYSLLVRKDGDNFDYNKWVKENIFI